jgi:hypothetical protein
MQAEFETEQVAVDQLKASPWNPRTISPRALEKLKRSLRDFGLPQSIIANRRSGHIVGGHQRWQAAKELDWPTVPVTWVDLSEDEEKALNVALNNMDLQGEWDTQQLAKVLQSITDRAMLEATGIDQQKIDAMIENLLKDVEEEKPPVYPLVPRFLEHYAYAVIITQHETDWANLQEMLGMEKQLSYKSNKVATGRIVPFEAFRKRFEQARQLTYGPQGDRPHVYQRAHLLVEKDEWVCGLCGQPEPNEVHVPSADVVTFLDWLIDSAESSAEPVTTADVAKKAAELKDRIGWPADA